MPYFCCFLHLSQYSSVSQSLVRKSFYYGSREKKKTYCYSKSLQKSVLKSIISGHFIYKSVRNPKKFEVIVRGKFFINFLVRQIFFQCFLVRKLNKFGKHCSIVWHMGKVELQLRLIYFCCFVTFQLVENDI